MLQFLLAVAAAPLQNYCPIVIENNTGMPASDVYFVAHGLDPSGSPCWLVPDGSTGICSYVYPGADGTNGSYESSRALSELPSATGTAATAPAYLIYLPINVSSRGYISINQPLFIETDSDPSTGFILISDPAVTSLNDPNYYTFYQDFEFGIDDVQTDSTTLCYLNLSWVDYFCLPMQLNTYMYPSNTLISINTPSQFQEVVPAGTTATLTREQVISNVNAILPAGSWQSLGLLYYDNPYTDPSSTNYIRILAAKNSLSYGDGGVTFVDQKTPQTYFPTDYISDPSAGPSPGTSFVQAAYNYYISGTLSARIKPAGIDFMVYTISSVTTGSGPTDLTLQFITTDLSDRNITLDLSTLTTEQLLSGSVWPFQPLTMDDQVDQAISNELSKLVSALFTVGQFPFTAYATSVGSPFNNTNEGFATLSYFANPPEFSSGYWWNVYDKALHLQMISQGDVPNNPTLGFGYAYDFDDLLNMSGLIGGLTIQNEYGNPSTDPVAVAPYVLITMESLAGSTIPDIASDSYTYQVTVGSAANGMTVTFTHYNGSSTVNTPALVASNSVLGNVVVDEDHPFVATFQYEDGLTHTFDINLQHQIVRPRAPLDDPSAPPPFTGVDRKYQSGIRFDVTNAPSETPQFLLTFDSSPPPWNQ